MTRFSPSPAMAVAIAAVVLALTGGAVAATSSRHTDAKKDLALIKKYAKKLRGPRGRQGQAGATGATGASGAKGNPGAKGDPGTPALFKRTLLTETGIVSHTATQTPVLLATLGTFTKDNAATAVKVTWNDAVGGGGDPSTDCQYQLRIDGVANPLEEGLVVYGDDQSASLTTVFSGLSAGSHSVQVWNKANVGSPSCAINGGNFSHQTIVEETP